MPGRGKKSTKDKGIDIDIYRLNLVRSFSILAFHSHDSASSPSLPARPMPLSTLRNLRVHRGCEITRTRQRF